MYFNRLNGIDPYAAELTIYSRTIYTDSYIYSHYIYRAITDPYKIRSIYTLIICRARVDASHYIYTRYHDPDLELAERECI